MFKASIDFFFFSVKREVTVHYITELVESLVAKKKRSFLYSAIIQHLSRPIQREEVVWDNELVESLVARVSKVENVDLLESGSLEPVKCRIVLLS